MAELPVSTAAMAAVTLSSIAYTEGPTDGSAKQKAAILEELENIGLHSDGPWSLIWGPSVCGGVLALVAVNQSGSRFALSIRGRILTDSWSMLHGLLQHADPLSQREWHYPRSSEIMIAGGFTESFHSVMAMTDPVTGWCLLDFLRSALKQSNAELLVTGHSLGGTLASMAALWLHDQLPRAGGPENVRIVPHVFAAPTAGNKAFADRYDEVFPESFRYVNPIDPIPMVYGGISHLIDCFPEPGPQLRSEAGTLIYDSLCMLAPMLATPTYVHTNQRRGTVVLPGVDVCPEHTFAQEVTTQHSVFTYAQALGKVEMVSA